MDILQIISKRLQVQVAAQAQCSSENPSSTSRLKTVEMGMKVSTSTRQSLLRVRHHLVTTTNNPKQVGFVVHRLASDAGAPGRSRCRHNRSEVYPPHPRACRAGSAGPGRVGSVYSVGAAESGRMSMRQPVKRAARRAFWPSRPIANES